MIRINLFTGAVSIARLKWSSYQNRFGGQE
jgi:hypothetical protein